MRTRALLVLMLLPVLACPVFAQVSLLSENFESCSLPSGWQVNITGNQNAFWTVGYSQNNDALGQSIDGSCCLIIDDDHLGNNTPGYVIDFVSPVFNTADYSRVDLSMDVHYRDWAQANDHFDVLLSDGVNEYLLSRFDKTRSNGALLSDHFKLNFDLSLLPVSSEMHLVLRYDDDSQFDWWAAVDNIQVTGYQEGTNVVAESFNACSLPAGWENLIVTGDLGWTIGKVDTASKAYGSGSTMNGSCFALFDDDLAGQTAPYSTVRLATPWFDGTDFARFNLTFDMILRYYKEHIIVIVQHGDGSDHIVQDYGADVGGPYFPNFVAQSLSLTPYRSQQMRVVFEFTDGNDWGWWGGIDNVKVTGEGVANDICINAIPLTTGADCLEGINRTAIFDGPPSDCVEKAVGSLWYVWTSDFAGMAKITTNSNFNDVVNMYSGGCGTLQPVYCHNRDEHGFTGESVYYPVQANTEYLIRVSGRDGSFGNSRGRICIEVDQTSTAPPPPANDDCLNALPLVLNAPCSSGNNLNAGMSATLPSLNMLARADVWYKFTAPAPVPGQTLEIKSNSSFSDIITLYKGNCDNLAEIAGNHKGQSLLLPGDLTPGDNYYVQIAGNFATVEGPLCPQLLQQPATLPTNDDCLGATLVPIGGQCVPANILNSRPSGFIPPCVPTVGADVWYKFVAPNSGIVRMNSGANFEHVLAIWKGNCNDLGNVFCVDNPLRCDGYQIVPNLSPGQTYYVQIATRSNFTALGTGDICLKILDINTPPDFQPLELKVTEVCTGPGTAVVSLQTTGGVQPFETLGTQSGQELASGTPFIVVVKDAMGCEKSFTGVVDDCSASSCLLTASMTAVQPNCNNSEDGSLSINTSGGTGPFQFLWSNGSTEPALYNIAAGDYSVTITDALGCNTVATQSLINPAPITIVASDVVQPTIGQSNGSIVVDISGAVGNYGVQWFYNGTLFANGTEDLFSVPAGEYMLTVIDNHFCMASFNITLVEVVGSTEPGQQIIAEVFPNPADQEATLAVNFPKAQDLLLTIFDQNGRTIHSWTVKNALKQQIAIPVKDLPAGAYQLHIKSDQVAVMRTLIKG